MSDQQLQQAAHPLPPSALIPLDDVRVVRVSGPGTDRFLHGQLTQNLEDVTSRNAPRAAACTPKGRAYALTRLVRDGEDVLFCLPESLAEDTLTHLRKFLMLFRGTTMTVQDDWRVFGLLGEALADTLLEGAAVELDQPDRFANTEGGFLVRTQDTGDGLVRFEFWAKDRPPGWGMGVAEAPATWHASEIAAGVASLTPPTREAYVPQMLNWQHLNGIHFRKGCYTGQEVIARMHFLGQLKKSLYRLYLSPLDTAPAPGTRFLAGTRSAGEVVNAVALGNGTVEVLAVLRHDMARQTLSLDQQESVVTVHMPLPYSVPEQAEVSDPDIYTT